MPSESTAKADTTSARLFYEPNGGGPTPLPYWAQTLLLFGSAVPVWDDAQSRIVAALALPCRPYAAAIVAAGLILERAKVETARTYGDFQRIASLPPGTALVYNRDGYVLRAVFDGTEPVRGELRLRVRVQKKSSGRLTYLLDAKQALGLRVVDGIDGECALGQQRLHRNGNSPHLFVENLISHTGSFLLYPQMDCFIIGTVAALRTDLRLPLVSQGLHGTQRGTLNDIVRMRRFLSEGEAYHSEGMAVGADALLEISTPYVVLFDGALAFLKWREAWRHMHWVVVFDRTETHFTEAVNVLNQEYVNDRIDADLPPLPKLPEGMETLVFKERR